MKGWHVTTPRKVARYRESHDTILPPVRFWSTRAAAEGWARQTGRSVLVPIDTGDDPAYPLPDHRRDDGRAYWTPHPQAVRETVILRGGS